MAGSPLKRRVRDALQARTLARFGEDADILDYACDWISNGGTVARLAQDISREIGAPVSRPLVSAVLNNAAPDATERLDAARREGAAALVDEAVQLADDAEISTAGVQKARLQVGTRHWMAERFDPATFGQKGGAAAQFTIGQLFLTALQQPAPPRPAALTSGDSAAALPSAEAIAESESPAE